MDEVNSHRLDELRSIFAVAGECHDSLTGHLGFESHLAGEAGSLAFEALLSFFDAFPDEGGFDSAVEITVGEIGRWPAEARRELAHWATLEPLLASPGWRFVRQLTLEITDAAQVESLAARAELASLRALHLVGAFLDAPAMRALVESPYLASLQSLRCPMTEDGEDVLLTSALVGRLRDVSVDRLPDDPREMHIERWWVPDDPEQVQRLNTSCPPSLRELYLAVGPDGKALETVASANHLHERIVKLVLFDFEQAHFERLSHCTFLRQVREIEFAGTMEFSSRSLRALGECSFVPKLTGFRAGGIAGEGIGDDILRQLSRWPLNDLRSLTLVHAGCSDRGGEELVKSTHMPQLAALDLSGNRLGPLAAAALSQWECLANARVLNLSGNSIGEKGAEALAKSEGLRDLRSLSLEGIRSEGIAAIAQSPCRRLESLSLSEGNSVTGGMRVLAESDLAKKLVHLHMNWSLEDRDVELIANSPKFTRLRRLGLSANRLTARGMDALANSPHLANLWMLDVGSNDIGDDGARTLARSPYLKRIVYLGLPLYGISPAVAAELASSENMRRLRWLVIGEDVIEPWIEAAGTGSTLSTRLSVPAWSVYTG
jgi:hypothetical protein